MITLKKTRELESYVIQARRNLAHYEKRLDNLIKLQHEGKTNFSRHHAEQLSNMISNEESAVSQYKGIIADVENKLMLAKADIGQHHK